MNTETEIQPNPPPPFLAPESIEIALRDANTLVLNLAGDRIVLGPPRRALPLSDPERYIVLYDRQGSEIGVIRDLAELDPRARAVLQDEIDRLYTTHRILRILDVSREPLSGHTCWRVEVERTEVAETFTGTATDLEVAAAGIGVGAPLDAPPATAAPASRGALRRASARARDTALSNTELREFEIAGQEDVQTARYPLIYIVDVDRNRYEITDCEALDLDSRRAAERFF